MCKLNRIHMDCILCWYEFKLTLCNASVVSKQAMEGKTTTAKQSKNFKSKTSLVMEDEESLELNDVGDKEHTAPSKISATNLFAAVTCISFIISIPLTVMIEGNILWDIINLNAKEKEDSNKEQSDRATLLYMLISGLFHYLNNEVMYLVLSNVHPITLAVGNTMKRVFIIVASVIVFSTPVSLQTALGSAIGLGGVLLYSLMKQWYGISQTRTISIKPQLTP